MDKTYYKALIEKTAFYNDNGTLVFDGDDYADFLDVNPTLVGDKAEQEWDKAIKDVNYYINNHPKKKQFLEEDKYNSERDKVQNPNPGKSGRNRFIAGGVIPLAIGAGLGVANRKGQGKLNKVFGGLHGAVKALPYAGMGAVAGGINGLMKDSRKDEDYKNKHFGKYKQEVWSQINNDLEDYLKDKHYGYDNKTASDYLAEIEK